MILVKICGITNLDDALAAIEAGADMLGFNLYPGSPRYVPPGRVADIVSAVRHHLAPKMEHGAREEGRRILLVGVFVNEPLARVRAICDECGLDLAQLHGSEPPQEVRALRPRAYKAIRPRTIAEAEAIVGMYAPTFMLSPYQGEGWEGIPDFLVDACKPWAWGGTGEHASWDAALWVARRYRTLLAGGLTPEDVVQAIALVKPWGVDVASGVEIKPGVKDHRKLREFVKRAKGTHKNGKNMPK